MKAKKGKTKAKPQAKAPKLKQEEIEDGAFEEYQEDPVKMVREVLGSALWSHQKTLFEYVRDNPRVSWRSCHGIGKSFGVARLVLWFLFSFEYSIVITTSPTWRQVEKIVWKEIRSAYANAKIPLGGNLAPKATQLSIDGDEWTAMGLSTNMPDRFQGFHAENLMVVVDEAAGVKEDIFEAVEGVLTSEHCRLVLIGNPTDIGGTFYRSFREPGWKTGATSAFDTPNFTHFGITEEDFKNNTWKEKITGPLPAPWLITPAWAYDKWVRWGKHHPAYSARVDGVFPEQGEYNVIPLSWIERAQNIWEETEVTGQPVLGVDVARGGMDRSAIAIRVDNKVLKVLAFHGLDTQELAGEVIRVCREVDARLVNVEIDGLGAGVADELKKHRDIPLNEVTVGSGSDVVDAKGNRVYGNLRAQMWWALRNALDPKGDMQLALPPDDDELLADLAAPHYNYKSGPIQIEKKEDTKDRLGRSPDEGDAVMLTFAPIKKPQHRLVIPRGAPVTPAWMIQGYGH